jgi:AraC-like DNA-binding protein
MSLSVVLVRALIECVEHLGIRREAFLEAARLSSDIIDQSDGRISLEDYDTLQEVARTLTGEQALGLRMGEVASATTHSVTAHLVAYAPTLGDAIDGLVRYQRLLTGRPIISLRQDATTATLLYDVAPGTLECRRFRAEVAVTGFCRMVRFFGRDRGPDLVAFEHEAPPYRAEYARLFDGAEQFSRSFSGLVFPRELLSASQMHGDPEFHAALRSQAEKKLSRLLGETSYAERVREHVLDPRATNRRDMASAARALGLSPRSLRRKLQREGASFSDVVDDALAALAKRLLADEARSIEATAYELGFSAPSAFHKAFKRWTGVTPKDYQGRAPAARA